MFDQVLRRDGKHELVDLGRERERERLLLKVLC